MNAKILRIGVGIATCLALGTSVALAADNPFTTRAPSLPVHTSTTSASPTPAPFLSTDNLKEFTQKQNQAIEAFKKQKMDELKTKTDQIKTQRKQCADNVKALMDQRKAARLELVKSCKPTFSTSEPANADEAKQRAAEAKGTLLACRQKLADFDKETKTEITNIQKQCFNGERQVLGLSTLIPYNQQ
jgi:FtsZ-binding cell division protein ZapB